VAVSATGSGSIHKLLALLDANADRAAEKLKGLSERLAGFFEWNGCRDPQDLAQEVFVRCIRRLDEGQELEPGVNAISYVFGFARMLLLESRRCRRVDQEPESGFDLILPIKFSEEQRLIARAVMNHRLKLLTHEELVLLKAYCLEDTEALADRLNLSPGNLRLKIYRIREKMAECKEDRASDGVRQRGTSA
jgi:DNA-directed RNA polymerase specialized sigma24 family protein